MKLVLICTLPLLSIAINFDNNACTSFEAYHILDFSRKCYHNPDVLSDVPSMAERHNYKTEIYPVTTSDGYILTLFRIQSKEVDTKKIVFLQHGITINSAPWVDIGNRSLAFNLADLGYDVWLGNVRGSTYSNQHVRWTVLDPEFWNFNLDTIAQIDIGTQLKFIANETGKGGNITFIGHSMGTTLALMFCSEYYNEAHTLVKELILLAPVVYLNDIFILELVKPLMLQLFIIVQLLDFSKIYSYTLVTGLVVHRFTNLNNTYKFQKYDYGSKENNKIYDNPVPPTYDLWKVKMPVHLFYGISDSLFKKENLDRLFNELGSLKKFKYKVPSENNGYDFNHIDFLYAAYIKEFLYKKIFEILGNDE
ncbi:lipase 1-like, partial [Asbolus verrucosus]